MPASGVHPFAGFSYFPSTLATSLRTVKRFYRQFPPDFATMPPEIPQPASKDNRVFWLLMTFLVFVPLTIFAVFVLASLLFCGGCTLLTGSAVKDAADQAEKAAKERKEYIDKAHAEQQARERDRLNKAGSK